MRKIFFLINNKIFLSVFFFRIVIEETEIFSIIIKIPKIIKYLKGLMQYNARIFTKLFQRAQTTKITQFVSNFISPKIRGENIRS